MASLAIKGHATRGSEVIALLEMLGGNNVYKLTGNTNDAYAYYTINGFEREIRIGEYIFGNEDICFFTLEQFEEKFPYKVGDKVITDDGDKASIVGMIWDNDLDDIFYETKICNEVFKYPKELLEPYKEERDKTMAPNLVGEDYSGKRFGYKIPQGYEFDCIQNNEIIIKPIKPKYPKTYKECCDVLGLNTMDNDAQGYKADLIIRFQELLIARAAYWKIAGEQLGLEEPWQPDWNHINRKFYCIYNSKNNIVKNVIYSENKILAFPTEEMRDAFYENFKKLIENCKELL